jgi:hypothetical protein
MTAPSPFSNNRFEHEVRHLYFIPTTLYETLEQAKPCILIGARGTGKSTLLRSLSWRERTDNEGLKKQLASRSANDFIGIYLKTPEVHVDVIGEWLSVAPGAVSRGIYSRYLELVQLQEIFGALAEIQAAGGINVPVKAEFELVARLLKLYRAELSSERIGTGTPRSFADLSDSTRMIRKWIERASQNETDVLEVADLLGNPQTLGVMSSDICDEIVRTISPLNPGRQLYFKVCFDEAEVLDEVASRIISTWIRLARAPLFHVVSYVSRPPDMAETFAPNLTIQNADVNTVDLDVIQDAEFKKFAEGVVTLRVREYFRRNVVGGGVDEIIRGYKFECERVFGKLNINFLLEDILKQSVSPSAQELLARAKANVDLSVTTARGGDGLALPIYETYLEDRTGRPLPDATEPKWRKRRNSSSNTRKAMIAAYLSIAYELKQEPRYAYADMILQLSDSCIRDFLSNLQWIFEKSGRTLTEFVQASKLRPTIQDAGLKAASNSKQSSLPTYGMRSPSATAKLVTGLGRLTAKLQCQSLNGVRHLKSTERGLFRMPYDKTSEPGNRAAALVIDASEAGFLKIETQEPLLLTFRLHTSLAPYFKSSYRGAYYSSEVSAFEVLQFADAVDDDGIEKAVATLFNRIDGGEELSPGLFDGVVR